MRRIYTKFIVMGIILAISLGCGGAINAIEMSNEGMTENGYHTGVNPDIVSNTRSVEVFDWHDLDDVRNDLSGSYVLMNDLDEDTPGYDDVAGPSANAGAGWDPLGSHTPANPFTGTFDGNGYFIKGLYINRPSLQVAGLFAKTDGGAVIRNLGLKDVDITGADGAGALVGVTREDSWIERCYVDGGTVEGVSSNDFSVAGLVAQNAGMITDCYTSVTVTGENLLHVGGIVGLHLGFLRNSYATGEVIGGGNAGGLVGTNAAIANYPSRGHVINSFSDSDTTGVSDPIGDDDGISENAEAHPTSIMQSMDTYEGWDIAIMGDWSGERWYLEDGIDYPRLYYQIPYFSLTIDAEGSGITDPSPGTYNYTWGEAITITASPDSGYIFNNWLGDYPDSLDNEDKYNHEITVIMDGHKEITAKFVAEGIRERVVESERGWTHETHTYDRTDIMDGSLMLGEIKTASTTEREAYPGTGTTWQTYWETTVDVGSAEQLTFNYDYNLQVFAGGTPRYAEVRLTMDDDQVWIDSLTPQHSFREAQHVGVVNLTSEGEITLRFQARSTTHTWVTDPIVTVYGAGYSVYVPEDEGAWHSTQWRPGFEDHTDIDSFRVGTVIENDQEISVRIGVDSTDDGLVDTWSDWQGLTNGTNELDGNTFDLPSGYGYTVEFDLIADQGSPRVTDYVLVVKEDTFVVNIDDITAGESPIIEIEEAKDELEAYLEGEHQVTMMVNGATVIETLNFTTGAANYTWVAMETSGHYTGQVIIYDASGGDSFQVFTGDADAFEVNVDDITAGEHPVIGVFDAEDEFENLLEGAYNAEISIDGDSITTELMFSGGNATYTWAEMNVTGDYVAIVEIDGVSEDDTFTVFTGDVDTFQVLVENITAGEQPLIEISHAEDEFGNALEGIYNVTLVVNGDSLTMELEFSDGEAEHEYDQMTVAGEYTASVTIDGVSESDDFSVLPGDVDEVIITPAPEAEVAAGVDLVFTAEALDEYGNLITDNVTDFTWTGAADGIFNEETVGEYEVNATYEGVTSNTTTVMVVSAGAYDFHVSVDNITAGEHPIINITDAEDEFGNVLNGTYSASISVNGGLVTVDIEFSEGDAEHEYDQMTAAGVYTVEVTIDGVNRSDEFTVYPGEMDHILITPATSTIEAGGSQAYNSTARDEYGNELGDVTANTTWEIHTDAGGEWDDNVYTSQFSGTWTVTGTYEEFSADAVLTVTPGDVESVTISPSDNQTVAAGTDLVFSAQAWDSFGNLITDVPGDFTWQNAVNGVFNQGSVGTYDVTATYDTETSPIVTVTVTPGVVDSVTITPSEPQSVMAGVDLVFTAEAVDAFGNVITNTVTDFTWSGADTDGVFNQQTVGTYDVTAAYGGETSPTTTVTVTPGAVDSVTISPSTPQTVAAGVDLEFSAEAVDEFGNVITNTVTDFTWSGAGTDGVFNQQTVGTYDVTAAYGGETSPATTVTVTPGAVDSVTISPSTPQTVAAGVDLEFSAEALDQFGNVITDLATDFTWSGASTSGVFNQGTVGTYSVTAAYGGVTSPATSVTVTPGAADSVVITPDTDQTIISGDSIDFSASAYDAFGNLITDDDTDFTWSGAGAGGLFDESEPGTYTVSATYQGVQSSTVTVTVTEDDDIEFELTIVIQGQGTTSPAAGTHTYDEGTDVTITATPATGWEFVRWEGDATGTSPSTTVTMDDDKTVTAVFEEIPVQTYTLTIIVDGDGTTDPAAGTHEYDEGTTVTITATSASGWEFVRWEGDATGTSDSTTVTMDSDKTVTAIFETDVDTFTLTIGSTSGGSVTSPGEGTFTRIEGTSVDLVAVADDGYEFVRWDGDTGTIDDTRSPTTTITMDGDYSITAEFREEPDEPIVEHDLTITIDGQGTTNPAAGTHSYEEGDEVTVTATPASGWKFVEWTGAATGTDLSVTVTMDDDKSITAVFEVDDDEDVEYVLTIATDGQGSTNPAAGTHTYDDGETVTVTATAASGWEFVEWTGDASGTSTSVTVTMDQDRTITAVFEEVDDDDDDDGILPFGGIGAGLLIVIIIIIVLILLLRKRGKSEEPVPEEPVEDEFVEFEEEGDSDFYAEEEFSETEEFE